MTSVFFFSLVLKVDELADEVDGVLSQQLRKAFSFNVVIVTVYMTASIVVALVLAAIMAAYTSMW